MEESVPPQGEFKPFGVALFAVTAKNGKAIHRATACY
jgi:hypothetical protein